MVYTTISLRLCFAIPNGYKCLQDDSLLFGVKRVENTLKSVAKISLLATFLHLFADENSQFLDILFKELCSCAVWFRCCDPSWRVVLLFAPSEVSTNAKLLVSGSLYVVIHRSRSSSRKSLDSCLVNSDCFFGFWYLIVVTDVLFLANLNIKLGYPFAGFTVSGWFVIRIREVSWCCFQDNSNSYCWYDSMFA